MSEQQEQAPVIPVMTVSSSTPEAFICPEEGAYLFELTGISDVKMRGFGNLDPNKLECKVHLMIVGGEFDGVVVKQFMSLSAHTSSFMYELVTALNHGERLSEGTPLNIADFIGRRCKGLVSVTEKPSTREPGKTVTYPKVVSVKPLPITEPGF